MPETTEPTKWRDCAVVRPGNGQYVWAQVSFNRYVCQYKDVDGGIFICAVGTEIGHKFGANTKWHELRPPPY